jgi:lysophospholipid acyltransferase (LPLAT)-like uncharacterized protein
MAWGDRIIPILGVWYFRFLSLTVRHSVENEELLADARARESPLILVSWHGRLLLGVLYFAKYAPLIAVSQSIDGDRIAKIVERLGWRTARGSSSRGGVRALLSLVREVRKGKIGAHIVDGPRGPAGVIKPGLMMLAQRSGAPILPVYASARLRFEAPSWDRIQIPLPFAHIHLRIGEPVRVPADFSKEQVAKLCAELELELHSGYRSHDAAVRGR